MSVACAPTGQQTMSQREVDQFLQEARSAPTTKSPRVLGINMARMMKEKNNGYPVDMHHPTLQMRQALREEEETALAQLGYQREYIRKDYPKVLFRRNMAPHFEPQFDNATGIQMNHGFVEERAVRDEKHEAEIRAMKPKKGESLWFEKVTDIPDIEGGPSEDPAITIARLQGELAGVTGQAAPQRSGKSKE